MSYELCTCDSILYCDKYIIIPRQPFKGDLVIETSQHVKTAFTSNDFLVQIIICHRLIKYEFIVNVKTLFTIFRCEFCRTEELLII